jgi:hypothetical protein
LGGGGGKRRSQSSEQQQIFVSLARRTSTTHSELPLQAGRQLIAFAQAGRKVVMVLVRPGAHFAAKQAYNSLFDRMFSWFPGMLISDWPLHAGGRQITVVRVLEFR